MADGEAKIQQSTEESSSGLITAGYVCAFLSLLIAPPFLGLAGLIIGIINLTKSNTGHGVAQIILSVICAIIGIQLGAAVAVLISG